uniref:Putative secreted protein n=1 Tax=Anopheles marajoara TaxID=58244 RepID=A0A2M4CFR1_9DIPT
MMEKVGFTFGLWWIACHDTSRSLSSRIVSWKLTSGTFEDSVGDPGSAVICESARRLWSCKTNCMHARRH